MAIAMAFELANQLYHSPQLRKHIVCDHCGWKDDNLDKMSWPTRVPATKEAIGPLTHFHFFSPPEARFKDQNGKGLEFHSCYLSGDPCKGNIMQFGLKALIFETERPTMTNGPLHIKHGSRCHSFLDLVFRVDRDGQEQIQIADPKGWFNLHLIGHLMETYRTGNYKEIVLSILRRGLSSRELLGRGFSRRRPASSSTIDGSELVWYDVNVLYRLLATNSSVGIASEDEWDKTLEHTIMTSMGILVDDLRHTRPRWNEYDVYAWTIVFANPLIYQPAYRYILRSACVLAESFVTKMEPCLLEVLESLEDVSLFRFMIRHLSTFYAENYQGSWKATRDQIGCIYLLKYMYRANERDGKARIPFTEFYNGPLVDKLFYKEEYQYWKKHHFQAKKMTLMNIRVATGRRSAKFSILNFPFLLDLFAKSAFVRIDSMMQMTHNFENSFVESAYLLQMREFFNLPETSSVATPSSRSNLESRLFSSPVPCPYLLLEIRRDHLVRDVFAQLSHKERELKKPLKVRFVNEEGLDQGGVQKELFQMIFNQLLDPDSGFFVYDDETHYSWFPEFCLFTPLDRQSYELIGLLLGLALYNGVMVSLSFPLAVYKKLLGISVSIDDLIDVFPELGNGLRQLLDYKDEEPIEDLFGLHFVVNRKQKCGGDGGDRISSIVLKPNGLDVQVTRENREEYASLYTQLVLDQAIREPFEAFSIGFHKICGRSALRLCRPEELESLLIGRDDDLDFQVLEKVARYEGGYHHEHPVIMAFWEILHALSSEQKKKFLLFVTASDRVPLKGLAALSFIVQRNGPDSTRLPTALTCFGRLLLPEYETKERLRSRLLMAIENSEGFGLV